MNLYTQILSAIKPSNYGMDFEGRIAKPGSSIDAGEMPPAGVVLECAGHIGTPRAGNRREMLWILWKWEGDEWRELGRAASVDWAWKLSLRAIALQAMNPRPGLVDVNQRGEELADAIMQGIDSKLGPEGYAVRKTVLHEVYDGIAARIALVA